jgi:hypothetical protein
MPGSLSNVRSGRTLPAVPRPRPDLLVAASVPVLLVAGVLPWQRDTMCTRTGCGSVTAAAWGGSPVWALLLLAGLATAGAWVLLLPVRGRAPIALAVLTAVVGVLAAAVVVLSLDGLVFNRSGLVGFPLPVTETFPVLAVHPGEGLVLALGGSLLQVVAGWSTLRHRNALVSPLRPPLHRDLPPAAAPLSPAPPYGSPASPYGSPAPPYGSPAPPRHAGVPGQAAVFGQGPPPPRRHRH